MVDIENKRRDRIAEAASKLIQQQGHLNLSLTQLSQNLAISYSTLYRAFESKSDLLAYCLLKEIKAMPAHLAQLQRMSIPNIEKMAVMACFPFYCSALEQGHLGLMFSGANTVLIREASGRYQQRIADEQSKLYQLRWQAFQGFARKGLERVDKHQIRHCYRLLHLISRGGALAAYQRRLSDEAYSLDEMIQFAAQVLQTLPWEQHEVLEPSRVKMIMRTLSDSWQ